MLIRLITSKLTQLFNLKKTTSRCNYSPFVLLFSRRYQKPLLSAKQQRQKKIGKTNFHIYFTCISPRREGGERMSPFYSLRNSKDGKYYFTLDAENNEVVLTSETYNLKISAVDGIQSVKVNSPYDTRYRRKVSTRGLSFFVLVAANGEIIGTSEGYSSTYAMESGIAVVKRIGPIAMYIDLTK